MLPLVTAVSVYEVVVTVPANVPFLYTSYALMPLSSVDAVQVSFTDGVEVAVPTKFVGVVGGVSTPVPESTLTLSATLAVDF
ncbi:hypothetical protein D3C76_1031380 [compost metagenome]